MDGGAGRGEAEGASDHVRGRASQTPERQEDRVPFRRGRKHLEIPPREEEGRCRGRQGTAAGGLRRIRLSHPRLDQAAEPDQGRRKTGTRQAFI